jgi:hypothetical protein
LNGSNTVALSIGLEVAKVTNMADLIGRSAVCLSVWVDCRCSLAKASIRGLFIEQPLTVGSGRCAAVGVVTELVDVHATLSVGIMAGDAP